MNVKPTLEHPSSATVAVAAMLSTTIAIGTLSAVVVLFQRDGAPLERVAVAERACAGKVYVSEREACMRELLDASRTRIGAAR
jgi:hypothetical protein